MAAGESDKQALVRELAEELGIDAEIGEQIGPDISLDVERVLRLYRVDIDEPWMNAVEHAELRWLTADELDDVDWLDADRVLVASVRALPISAENFRA